MYPLIAHLRGRRAVVIGGGGVAERKTVALLEAEASVTVIAPDVSERLRCLAAGGSIRWEARPYCEGDLAGATLAFAATNRDEVNRAVGAEARRLGVWLNDAADATRGDFSTPAVHRSGDLIVSVATGGRSPRFSKRVRDELAEIVDERYGAEAAALPERKGAPVLRAATRGSALARTQTQMVADTLAQAGIGVELVTISTKGDRVTDRSLAAIGGDGVFVKELESALREGRADIAVHSCKDLPSTLDAGMALAAITSRADPRDALCSERYPSLDALPAGARVGTSSPRRRAQLRALRDDLRYDDIRGNVDSRLRKLREGEYDAIVLAMAGLDRLGVRATHTIPFAPDSIVPAVAQGALAIETVAGSPYAPRLREVLNDRATALAVAAERAFLRAVRGGCQAPVGAHATVDGTSLHLRAAIAADDGSAVVRGRRDGDAAETPDAERIGMALAEELLAQGGAQILAAMRPLPLRGHLYLLPRTQDRPSQIARELRDAGADVVEAPTSEAAQDALAGRLPDAILFPSSGSVAAIDAYLRNLRASATRPTIAAMGPSSSEAAGAAGFPPDVVAARADVPAFVAAIATYMTEQSRVPQ